MPYKDYEMKKLNAKLKYDERRSKGLCVVCGDEIETERKGSVFCSACAYKRKFARKAFANACGHHDCLTCPYPHCISNEKLVEKRRKKRIEHTRKTFPETNRKWKEQGLCQRCGGVIEPELHGHDCRRCRDLQNEAARKRRLTHKQDKIINIPDENLCRRCHKAPMVYGYKVCYKCLEQIRAMVDKRKTVIAPELRSFVSSFFVKKEVREWLRKG